MHWDQEPDNAVGARLWYVFSGGLKVTPNVLPASCRQTVACRTLNRYRLCEPQRLATAPVLRVTDARSGTAGSWRAPTLFLARIGTMNLFCVSRCCAVQRSSGSWVVSAIVRTCRTQNSIERALVPGFSTQAGRVTEGGERGGS